MTHDLQYLGISALSVEPPPGGFKQLTAGLRDLRSVRSQTPVHVIRRWLRLDQPVEADPIKLAPDDPASPVSTALAWASRLAIGLFLFFLLGSIWTDIRDEPIREARAEARYQKTHARKIAVHVIQASGPRVRNPSR